MDTSGFRRILFVVVGCGISCWFASVALSQDFFFASDRFGYTGTVTVYDSFADAQNQVNPRSGPHSAPQRDLSLYFNLGTSLIANDFAAFFTAWYYTTAGGAPYSGSGNPNNTNHGFLQFYDDGATTTLNVTGMWSVLDLNNPGSSEFTLSGSGVNATSNAALTRLWNAPSLASGPSSLTIGDLLEWDLMVVAGGLTVSADTEYFYSADHPTNVSGHIRGIFHNTNVDPTVNGFYRFDFSINMNNWAWDNRDSLNGDFRGSFFATVVPEPASGILIGLVLAPFLFSRRLRCRRVATSF
ncbi:MAG TPA: PEP-CTERM sorting domain-containing protein [Pirellulaceae bacterium]|nr:PEP-CTERM sorting domain-containing protein [Pirellulaceae bacterium]HMO91554.1 PEP-CTERM sorting domain-containing protein [Pirellulaceae bacterium]HMP68251.1 PEP-CTERM sorting domain-containing protein [Pirellulaceae bacterium]